MIVQVEVGGRVLKPNESTTRPIFTTLAVDTMSTQLRTEEDLGLGIENHLPCLSRDIPPSAMQHTGNSPKAEA
jgi:hypothetical protein